MVLVGGMGAINAYYSLISDELIYSRGIDVRVWDWGSAERYDKASVSFIKENINTCKDIGGLDQIDQLFIGKSKIDKNNTKRIWNFSIGE